MGKGKLWRAERHVKETLRRLDYVQRKTILKALTLWASKPDEVKPERKRHKLTVAERIRFKWWLWWKYGPECGYCHRAGDWRNGLTIDHIQPVSKGGSIRDIQNMVLACAGCNQAKGNTWLG